MKIIIRDYGMGIPKELLDKILSGDRITKKKEGNGLGLWDAIRVVQEKWRGELKIDSEEEKGTTIEIILKKNVPPFWFCSELDVSLNEKVVVLDDDEIINKIWRKNLIIKKNCNIFILKILMI